MLSRWKRYIEAENKIVAVVLLVLAIGIAQSKSILSVTAGVIMLLLIITHKRTGIRFYTIVAVVLFAGILSLIQVFTVGQNILYTFDMHFLRIDLYEEGVEKGIISFLKIWGSMGAVMLLMHTISFGEFINALKWYRLPKAFIEVLTFAVKFIYIFREEATNVIKAQRCRLGYNGICKSIVSVSSVAGIVLTRAYDRSKTLSKSMKSRGYHGNT
ncbi:MAG: energy-coupling factor transporter transmembrane protein EcfT [Clostridia bacterium]|nr:energy-coupling factor transporter transmembrane protein EcfT [Clostridia bacterium]